MKKFVIIGPLIVIAAAIAVAFANLSSIVNSNKDFLVQRIEKSLGCKIAIGKVGISFGRSLGVEVEEFSISDLPRFSSEPLLKARSFIIKIKILPLLKKKFEVKSIELQKPVVNIIRDKKGRLNVLSIKRQSKESGSRINREDKKAQLLAIALFNINDGEVLYEDRVRQAELRLSMIDSKVEGINISRPIPIDLRGAILSNRQNLEIMGTLSPVGGEASQGSLQFAGRIHLSAINRGKLMESRILSSLPPSIPSDINAYFLIRENEILIDSLLFEFAGGKTRCSGRMTIKGDKQSISLSANLKGAEAQELASGKHVLKDRLDGEMDLDVDLQAAGSDIESLKRNLTGRGRAGLINGKITGLNIAREVIEEIAKYPGMAKLLEGKLLEGYPGVFKARDTEIREWESSFLLEEGKISFGKMNLQAGDYSIEGEGYVNLDFYVDIAANMIFSRNLSRDIIREVNLARYFIDSSGSIVIPLRFRGRFPKVSVSPNEGAIQKKLQEALLKGGLRDLLPKKAKDLLPH